MKHRPSISKLYVSPSYASLASQTTLTEETTIPSSKTSSPEDDGSRTCPSPSHPPAPPIITSPFDDHGDDDNGDEQQITPTAYNIRKRPYEKKVCRSKIMHNSIMQFFFPIQAIVFFNNIT